MFTGQGATAGTPPGAEGRGMLMATGGEHPMDVDGLNGAAEADNFLFGNPRESPELKINGLSFKSSTPGKVELGSTSGSNSIDESFSCGSFGRESFEFCIWSINIPFCIIP
jgi:hypothetical protein